jgi:hypothetical protein
MLISDSKQSNIFSDDQRQQHFAELCNALYERELQVLAQQSINNISLLQRKIGGLRHHIKRAADQFLSHGGPLQVDLHNGTWQSKQAAKCMAKNLGRDLIQLWFVKYDRFGLCVPVHVLELGVEHIELDSVDLIEVEDSRMHLNKHGWFSFNGDNTEAQSDNVHCVQKRLLKPSKALLAAACCGHTWTHRGRSHPRTLSLRELLLSGSINWQTFR